MNYQETKAHNQVVEKCAAMADEAARIFRHHMGKEAVTNQEKLQHLSDKACAETAELIARSIRMNLIPEGVHPTQRTKQHDPSSG
jgi:hypothetical protein